MNEQFNNFQVLALQEYTLTRRGIGKWALSPGVMEGQQFSRVFLWEGKNPCPLDGILCLCIPDVSGEPCQAIRAFLHCTGNVGTHVKKIGWQLLVSMGGWQLHTAECQNRGCPGAETLLELFDVGAEERCSARDETEWKISPILYGERQLKRGRDGQCVKIYN